MHTSIIKIEMKLNQISYLIAHYQMNRIKKY